MNRNSGSGTRVWFDTEWRKLETPTEKIHGYDKEVMAHSDAAVLIVNNRADVSLGLQAAAHQLEREIERLMDAITPAGRRVQKPKYSSPLGAASS